jgi:hypothetical protein
MKPIVRPEVLPEAEHAATKGITSVGREISPE